MVAELGGEISEYEIPDARVVGLPTFTEITTTMWYRVFLPELLGGVTTWLGPLPTSSCKSRSRDRGQPPWG